MNIYEKTFGEKHGKNLMDLSLADMKLLHEARKAEHDNRYKKSQKIKKQNLASKK